MENDVILGIAIKHDSHTNEEIITKADIYEPLIEYQ